MNLNYILTSPVSLSFSVVHVGHFNPFKIRVCLACFKLDSSPGVLDGDDLFELHP